jgi:hypothetical protein
MKLSIPFLPLVVTMRLRERDTVDTVLLRFVGGGKSDSNLGRRKSDSNLGRKTESEEVEENGESPLSGGREGRTA